MRVVRDEGGGEVPCAIWDPDLPGENGTGFEGLSRPLRVRLGPGDMVSFCCCFVCVVGLWMRYVRRVILALDNIGIGHLLQGRAC